MIGDDVPGSGSGGTIPPSKMSHPGTGHQARRTRL